MLVSVSFRSFKLSVRGKKSKSKRGIICADREHAQIDEKIDHEQLDAVTRIQVSALNFINRRRVARQCENEPTVMMP